MAIYEDRRQAGQLLAQALEDYRYQSNVLVLGLPRGGVPVAYEVAASLNAELDVMIVRKLGHPVQPEFAIGAIASGGVRILNEDAQIEADLIDEITEAELPELHRREKAYRGHRPYPSFHDRCVILVDDGLATGSTMRAAIAAVDSQHPPEIVVAVPVAPEKTVEQLRQLVDNVVCLACPSTFFAIGQFYDDFSQTSDEAVHELLKRSWSRTDYSHSPQKSAREPRER